MVEVSEMHFLATILESEFQQFSLYVTELQAWPSHGDFVMERDGYFMGLSWAGESVTSKLRMLSSSWESLRAPMMGITGTGRQRSQASATCAAETPSSLPTATTSRTGAWVVSSTEPNPFIISLCIRAPSAADCFTFSGRYLPVSKPLRKGDQASTVIC